MTLLECSRRRSGPAPHRPQPTHSPLVGQSISFRAHNGVVGDAAVDIFAGPAQVQLECNRERTDGEGAEGPSRRRPGDHARRGTRRTRHHRKRQHDPSPRHPVGRANEDILLQQGSGVSRRDNLSPGGQGHDLNSPHPLFVQRGDLGLLWRGEPSLYCLPSHQGRKEDVVARSLVDGDGSRKSATSSSVDTESKSLTALATIRRAVCILMESFLALMTAESFAVAMSACASRRTGESRASDSR